MMSDLQLQQSERKVFAAHLSAECTVSGASALGARDWLFAADGMMMMWSAS